MGSPAGTPRPAGRWPRGGESIATPAATGSPAMQRAAWRPRWPWMSRLASPCPGPQTCWPPVTRRSGTLPALPPMTRCAHGAGSPILWRSPLTPATRASAPGATRRARSRGPVTPNTPEAMPAFQATWREPLRRVSPPEHTRPVRGFSPDERRFGGRSVRRRRRTARGVQPLGAGPQVFAWFSVSGAVAPTTGERVCRPRPSLTAASVPLGVAAVAEAFADRFNSRRRDHRGAPTAHRLTSPANVRLGCFPPDGPERSPIERVWRDLTDDVAGPPCLKGDAQHDEGGPWWRAYEAPTRPSSPATPPWWRRFMHGFHSKVI
jgi:hypothetical protein